MGKSQRLYEKAKGMIPGGTQLLSKRPEMFLPDLWPAYFDRAKGCEVWDLDGKKYIDMSYMGIGACTLGYADKDVNNAVKKAIDKGSMNTLNSPEEVELAELLLSLHPWAQMTRYARCGGEAMAVAVRIARAKAQKDIVLFCGYHGWSDWYLAANLAEEKALDGHLIPGLSPVGVPRGLRGSAFPFQYNDTRQFADLIKKYRGQIAAVIVEPVRNIYPQKEFIEMIGSVTKQENIILMVDEVSSGWRLNVGGAHLKLGLKPDLAVFAKGMSNGYPMAAIIGKADVMDAAQSSFISSTYWTERIGPVAAIATIRKMLKHDVPKHLISTGKLVKDGWTRLAKKHDLNVAIDGIEPLAHFAFQGEHSLVLKTLFTQSMLERGFLATTAFYSSFAHKKHHVAEYLKAADDAMLFIKKALTDGNPQKYLKGPVCHSGFKRLN